MAEVGAHGRDDGQHAALLTELLPVLVISKVAEEDDDELLFEPDSPPSSRASSIGTPPTPEHRKFVWPAHKDDPTAIEKRASEPTDQVITFDSFTQAEDVNAGGCGVTDSSRCDNEEMCSSLDRSFSMVSTLVEDGDNEERTSMVSNSSKASSLYGRPLNATIQAVKEKTHRAASQPREAISRFQLQGGLVGWLHGEISDAPTQAGNSDDQTDPVSESVAATAIETVPTNTGLPAKALSSQRKSSMFANLYGKMKQKQEQLELKLQSLEEPGIRHSITCGERERARPTQARLSLQPTSRRSIGIDGDLNAGFDDFVSAVSANVAPSGGKPFLRRDSRLRSASSGEVYEKHKAKMSNGVRARLRSLSFANRTTKGQSRQIDSANSVLSSSALQWDAFPVEECLADPKLAAEFINTVMPGDESLLTLLYSIEEYETLATTLAASATDSTPSLETQVMMATTIIDRFLGSSTCAKFGELDTMGKEIRSVVSQYQISSESQTIGQSEGIAAAIAAQGASLPVNLFDGVYSFVFDKLREAYDSKFRLTHEYTRLLAHMKEQQEQLGDEKALQHLVLTFDQVIESEWCCTVFWVYLFRSAHHHRLSFIMEVKFKLRRLHIAAQQAPLGSPEAIETNKLLQHEILLICRRFLSSKALALPTTSPMLMRLKEELQGDAEELEKQVDEPDALLMQQMVDKLDAMRTQTRVDFKRMSFERFASFLTSALYRDYIVHPSSASSTQCTRADDLTQLLRTSRISFHQTAVSSPKARDLRDLITEDSNSVALDKAVATVFTFRVNLDGGDEQRFAYRSLYASPLEDKESVEGLQRRVEAFLIPEGIKSTGATTDATKRSSLCFNFLAGTGDDTIYGAVWRLGAVDDQSERGECGESKSTNIMGGVCILSRYPLVDGLRDYLRKFASACTTEVCDIRTLIGGRIPESPHPETALTTARGSLLNHCSQRLQSTQGEKEVMDSTFQDLFECLSITNAMRLFSLILQEKKIVLVSSSYSVLLAVGEALRAVASPLAWSHIYVPVLPVSMKGYLHCPTPFIFGLHTSYVRHCELPKSSDDLAVVNLDRDSVTGGGDVFMPPLRANALREKLTALCKPRLRMRDDISFSSWHPATESATPFPCTELRRAFQTELRTILRHLETFAFRFECADRTVSVVDTSNKSRQWPADAARFYSAVLQSQAFSTYLGGSKGRLI